MDVRLVMFKDDERRDFPIESPRVVIGRKVECDLRIPTGDVSREHCEITTNGVIVKVKDLGSSNGTFVNGNRVTEAQLRGGDRLSVGPVIFMVQIDNEPARITPHDFQIDIPAHSPAKSKGAPAAGAAAAAGAAMKASKPKPKDPGDEDFDIDEMFGDGDDDEEEFDLDSVELLDDDEDDEDQP